jgi:PAS domain S-box-containing protein
MRKAGPGSVNALVATLFRASPVGIAVVRAADGRLLEANDSFCRFWGERSGIVGRPVDEVVDTGSGDGPRLVEALRGEDVGEALEVDTRQGPQCVAVSSHLVDVDGALATVAFVRDITFERRARERIEASERRLRALFASIGDAILVIGRNGAVVDCNVAACSLFGYPRDELLGLDVRRLYDAPDQVREFRRRLSARRRRPGHRETFVFRRRDGATFPGEIGMFPLRHEDARSSYIGVIRDVTRREQAARELQQQALVFATIDEAVLVLDTDAVITDVNPGAERTFGRSRDEMLGRTPVELGIPEDADLGAEAVQTVRERGRWSAEFPFRRGDGERRVCEAVVVPIVQDGRVAGKVGVNRDVTERKRLEEMLLESEHRRRQVLAEVLHTEQVERARIAAELHDDTVQVMAASLVALDRLVRAVESGRSEDAVRAATSARATLDTALERTRRLMFELRPPLLEANGIADAVRELAEEAGREAGFAVDVDADGIGRYSSDVETLVYRTVREAVANARKHSAACTLRVSLAEDAARITGEVRDDGRGFDIAHARNRSDMRLHLGLEEMIERVRLTGGDISVDSAPGDGTTVRFAVPLAPTPPR